MKQELIFLKNVMIFHQELQKPHFYIECFYSWVLRPFFDLKKFKPPGEKQGWPKRPSLMFVSKNFEPIWLKFTRSFNSRKLGSNSWEGEKSLVNKLNLNLILSDKKGIAFAKDGSMSFQPKNDLPSESSFKFHYSGKG